MTDTSTDQWLQNPRLKVERAKRHIIDYRDAVRAFVKTDPNVLSMEPSAEPGYVVCRVQVVKPMPREISLMAADALYNLRSGLDQTISCCAKAAGHSPKTAYFPHGQDEAGFKFSLRRKGKEIPESVRAAITRLQPYYGGHAYLIQALHDLNIVDKHSDLLALAYAIPNIEVRENVPTTPTDVVWQHREGKIERAEPGTVLHLDKQIKIALTVTFSDVEAIKGQPALKVLNQMAELVSRTIDVMEEALLAFLAGKNP